MERLKAEESRLREQQQYGDWQKKEEHFHLKQATQRSKVSNGQRVRAPFNAITTHVWVASRSVSPSRVMEVAGQYYDVNVTFP